MRVMDGLPLPSRSLQEKRQPSQRNWVQCIMINCIAKVQRRDSPLPAEGGEASEAEELKNE